MKKAPSRGASGKANGGSILAVVALAAALVACLPGPVASQDAGDAVAPLTLSEAIERARASHPTLASARAGVDASEAGAAEARAALVPSLASEASVTRFAEPMVVAPLHGFDPTRPPTFDRALVQGALSLDYTLFDGGARGARIRRARSLESAARAVAASVERGLLAQVAAAYLELGAAREVRAAQALRVDALAREVARAERVLAEGRAPRLAVLRAEAAWSGARADLAGDAERVELAERRLARLMGVQSRDLSGRAVVLPARPAVAAPPSRDSLIALAARSDEVESARARLAAAEAVSGEARALRLPALRLNGRYVEYGSGGGTFSGEWQGGLRLSFPLFTGGARGAAVDRAAAEASAAAAEVRVAELRAAEGVDAALSALGAAEARLSALEAAVARGVEVARIEALALAQGAGVQTDYITAEAEVARARAALAEAIVATQLARIDLARVTAELTPMWLTQNLEAGR